MQYTDFDERDKRMKEQIERDRSKSTPKDRRINLRESG